MRIDLWGCFYILTIGNLVSETQNFQAEYDSMTRAVTPAPERWEGGYCLLQATELKLA